ncbi:MAG: GRP family sugar transporter [Dysgonomonas sp.]|nr:GRP family sugar transporter [Dysgonomonas sp.]
MNVLDWLIASIPILSFGLLPVVATKIGGRAIDQSLGVALGSMLFALLIFFIRRPELNQHIIFISILSGVFWSVGSIGQFMGLKFLGVSKSMPISCGGQIVGTSLLGVFLGDWATLSSRIFGFSALAVIILGIVFTSYKSGKDGEQPQWKKGILINIVSSLGFTFYVGILKYYNISGWSSILPQSIGQIAGIILISLIFFKTVPFIKWLLRIV